MTRYRRPLRDRVHDTLSGAGIPADKHASCLAVIVCAVGFVAFIAVRIAVALITGEVTP